MNEEFTNMFNKLNTQYTELKNDIKKEINELKENLNKMNKKEDIKDDEKGYIYWGIKY